MSKISCLGCDSGHDSWDAVLDCQAAQQRGVREALDAADAAEPNRRFLARNAPELKLRPSKVEVDPGEYRRNHGAMPRGRGSWAFCKVPPSRLDYLDHVIWQSGLYAEAKKAAQAEAAALGVERLYVCS